MLTRKEAAARKKKEASTEIDASKIEMKWQTTCQYITDMKPKKTIVCGAPAVYQTFFYNQLGLCQKHYEEGCKHGIQLDHGQYTVGVSSGSRHYFKIKRS